MKNLTHSKKRLMTTLIVTPLLVFSGFALSNNLMPLVDDFNNDTSNSLGIARLFITDQTAGGNTTTEIQIKNGVMQVKGDLIPPRGQPAWASSVLPLGPENNAQDASQYSGIRLNVKVNKGSVTLTANSTKVTNFDYHSAPLVVPSDGKFHQVDIPFDSMKRAWSEQTKLDPKTLASLSIVAFSIQPSSYDFEIDQVSFY